MPPRQPTIIDVATAAKVGKTTVSDVLRARPGYNDRTRRRVLAAARRLGYEPHFHGRALRGGRTMSLAVIDAAPGEEVAQAVARGAEVAARQHGYVTYNVGWDAADLPSITRDIGELLRRRVDGIIFYSRVLAPPRPLASLLADSGLPIIYIDWAPPRAAHVIRITRRAAVQDLADHLAALGHRAAAFITSPFVIKHPALKLDAYRPAFARRRIKLKVSPRWTVELHAEDPAARFETIRARLQQGPLPSVLVTNSDIYACETLAACLDAGLRVPQDISITGFNDDLIAARLRPALTTIAQPREEVGRAAFALFERLVNRQPDAAHPPTPSTTIPTQFACRFVARQSTGPRRPHPD